MTLFRAKRPIPLDVPLKTNELLSLDANGKLYLVLRCKNIDHEIKNTFKWHLESYSCSEYGEEVALATLSFKWAESIGVRSAIFDHQRVDDKILLKFLQPNNGVSNLLTVYLVDEANILRATKLIALSVECCSQFLSIIRILRKNKFTKANYNKAVAAFNKTNSQQSYDLSQKHYFLETQEMKKIRNQKGQHGGAREGGGRTPYVEAHKKKKGVSASLAQWTCDWLDEESKKGKSKGQLIQDALEAHYGISEDQFQVESEKSVVDPE